MLVLSRQRDETIMIGDDIEVTVVDIRGDKVRLGINAPREVSVHRKEVYDAIRRENRAAAQVKPEDLSGLGKIALHLCPVLQFHGGLRLRANSQPRDFALHGFHSGRLATSLICSYRWNCSNQEHEGD